MKYSSYSDICENLFTDNTKEKLQEYYNVPVLQCRASLPISIFSLHSNRRHRACWAARAQLPQLWCFKLKEVLSSVHLASTAGHGLTLCDPPQLLPVLQNQAHGGRKVSLFTGEFLNWITRLLYCRRLLLSYILAGTSCSSSLKSNPLIKKIKYNFGQTSQ